MPEYFISNQIFIYLYFVKNNFFEFELGSFLSHNNAIHPVFFIRFVAP